MDTISHAQPYYESIPINGLEYFLYIIIIRLFYYILLKRKVENYLKKICNILGLNRKVINKIDLTLYNIYVIIYL